MLQIQNAAKLHKAERWKVRLSAHKAEWWKVRMSTTMLSSEKVGLSAIQFVKPTIGGWRNATRRWPMTLGGGVVPPGGDSLELHVSHFT